MIVLIFIVLVQNYTRRYAYHFILETTIRIVILPYSTCKNKAQFIQLDFLTMQMHFHTCKIIASTYCINVFGYITRSTQTYGSYTMRFYDKKSEQTLIFRCKYFDSHIFNVSLYMLKPILCKDVNIKHSLLYTN